MDLKLGTIFPCEAVWALKKQDQALIDLLFCAGVANPAQTGMSRCRYISDGSFKHSSHAVTGNAHNRHSARKSSTGKSNDRIL